MLATVSANYTMATRHSNASSSFPFDSSEMSMTRSACRASALPLVLFVAKPDLISIAPSKCHDECFKSIGAKNVLSMGDAIP